MAVSEVVDRVAKEGDEQTSRVADARDLRDERRRSFQWVSN